MVTEDLKGFQSPAADFSTLQPVYALNVPLMNNDLVDDQPASAPYSIIYTDQDTGNNLANTLSTANGHPVILTFPGSSGVTVLATSNAMEAVTGNKSRTPTFQPQVRSTGERGNRLSDEQVDTLIPR